MHLAQAYRFVWNTLLRLVSGTPEASVHGEDEAAKQEAQATAGYVLDEIYKLLHPFMPFMTEELWNETAERETLLCHARWTSPGVEDEQGSR